MNESSNLSNPTTESPTLEQMRSELRQKHVDPSRLAHVVVPGDNLFGEIQGWDGDFVKIKNPRRLTRNSVMTAKGPAVSIACVDWDMVDGGIINAKPIIFFHVKEMDEETQRRYLSIYLGYLQDKQLQAARAAGIEIAGADQMPRGPVEPSIFDPSGVRRVS